MRIKDRWTCVRVTGFGRVGPPTGMAPGSRGSTEVARGGTAIAEAFREYFESFYNDRARRCLAEDATVAKRGVESCRSYVASFALLA
jgi:hypothetical protein